ncbi:hypothetical protein GGI43DRAFT_241474 [Trichoderma evansii]
MPALIRRASICSRIVLPANGHGRLRRARPTRPNTETRNVSVDVGFDDASRPRARESSSAPGSAARGPAMLVPGDAQSIQGRFRLSAITTAPRLNCSGLKYAEGSTRNRQRWPPNRRDSRQVLDVPVLWAGMLGRY